MATSLSGGTRDFLKLSVFFFEVARPLAHGRTCIFTLRAFVKGEHRDTLG